MATWRALHRTHCCRSQWKKWWKWENKTQVLLEVPLWVAVHSAGATLLKTKSAFPTVFCRNPFPTWTKRQSMCTWGLSLFSHSYRRSSHLWGFFAVLQCWTSILWEPGTELSLLLLLLWMRMKPSEVIGFESFFLFFSFDFPALTAIFKTGEH